MPRTNNRQHDSHPQKDGVCAMEINMNRGPQSNEGRTGRGGVGVVESIEKDNQRQDGVSAVLKYQSICNLYKKYTKM